ncbi:unnamed protein product, partial [Didymodactylos carnosus]
MVSSLGYPGTPTFNLAILVPLEAAVCLSPEILCNPLTVDGECSSNSNCKCLSTTTRWGICAAECISCSALTRCQEDNVTCLMANTVCVIDSRCGNQPLCYPLELTSPNICPPVDMNTKITA